MKKLIVVMIVVLSMLVMFVGTVSAAPFTSGTATLISVDYIPGKGPVFTFQVSGHFSNADLKGALHVEGGADFDLYCTQVDSSTVKCTVSKNAAGKRVSLSWGGSTFWTSVPNAPAESCYNVYDWNYTGDPFGPFTNWVNYGTVCQERPAKYGDSINWYNPVWGHNYDYDYLPQSPNDPSCTTAPVSGDAYYYPYCPPSIPAP